MSRPLLLLTCFSCFLFSGCAVHQLRDDQDKIRSVLLELYTNQIMDNLVRAVNGLPIIQLDYTQAKSDVTVDANVSASDGLATSHSNMLTVLALKSVLVTRNLANNLMGGMGVTNTNVVAVSASPVTTSNELYDAYLRYLAEPGSLQVSECPPPKGTAHLCVRFEKKYYWIPMEFRELFFELASITTSQRGKALKDPDPFYTVSIEGLAEPPTVEQTFAYLIGGNYLTEQPKAVALANLLVAKGWLIKEQIANIQVKPDDQSADAVRQELLQRVFSKKLTDAQLKDFKAFVFPTGATAAAVKDFANTNKWPKDAPQEIDGAARDAWGNSAKTGLYKNLKKTLDPEQRKQALAAITNFATADPSIGRDAVIQNIGGRLDNGGLVVHVKINKLLPPDAGHIEFESFLDGTAPVTAYFPNPKEQRFKSNELTITLGRKNVPSTVQEPTDLQFPIPAKLTLTHFPPPQPTTKELLTLVPFQTPQVSFDTHPVPTELDTADSTRRAHFLLPQAVGDVK